MAALHAFARVRLSDGTEVDLGPGDLVGRLATAALHVSDARVSEAHALVSLRGGELKLLGLRGMFAVGRKPVGEVVLEPGLVIELAPGLAIEVTDVVLPVSVLALEAEGLPRQVLTGTTSVLTRPRLALKPRYAADADAHIWNTGERWVLRLRGDRDQLLEPGVSFTVGGHALRAVAVDLARAAQDATRVDGAVQRPLTLVARYETVHILRDGQPAVTLDGIMARLLSELVAFGAPASWHLVANEVWPEVPDRDTLRRRWDITLARMRRKLREAGVRGDLIRSCGRGQVELLLYPEDRVDDQS